MSQVLPPSRGDTAERSARAQERVGRARASLRTLSSSFQASAAEREESELGVSCGFHRHRARGGTFAVKNRARSHIERNILSDLRHSAREREREKKKKKKCLEREEGEE